MKTQPGFAAWLGLGALLASQAALAQRVVVLRFDGDRHDRLRTQIVRALEEANEVEQVPLAEYARAASGAGFSGERAMTPAALAAVAGQLGISVALEGTVSRGFLARILDSSGSDLWSRELPVTRGQISDRNAGRLAKALAAAAKAAPPPSPSLAAKEPEAEAPKQEAPPPEAQGEAQAQRPTAPAPLDLIPPEEQRRRAHAEDESHTLTGTEAAEEARDEDLEAEGRKRKRAYAGPKLIRVFVGGTTTWRSYCSRPSVTHCADYDRLPEDQRPVGNTADFLPQVPYAGFGLGLEFFPLASFDNPANGLGLSAAYSRGFSRTSIDVSRGDVQEPATIVYASDQSWHAYGHYRFHFGYGSERDPLVGYVGVRGGIAERIFEVDPSARVALPGAHRRFWSAGLELSAPVIRYFRIEAAGSYLLHPNAGPDELAGYGQTVQSTGWEAEGGAAGEIWGPLGYEVKFRWQSFNDQFKGAGQVWPEGGVAEESYGDLFWGLTAQF